MRQVIATVKPFRVRAVLEALAAHDLQGITIREVMGYGRQKNRLHRYLGSEYSGSYVPKVEITLFVADLEAPGVIRAIISAGRTGRMGDGKILVLPCLDAFASW